MHWLPALTGLRGVAAMAVVFYHLDVEFRTVTGEGTFPGLRFGWLGVDLFFVLSAYLLTRLLLHEGERLRWPAYGRYIWRRTLRIAPAYYVSIPLSLALLDRWWVIEARPLTLLEHLLYMQNMDPHAIGAINALYWTLAVEFQFYLLLPFLVASVRRWPAPVMAALVAGAVLWRWTLYDPDQVMWSAFTLPAFLAHFGLGIGAAVLAASGWKARKEVRAVVALAALAVALATLWLGIPAGSADQAVHGRWANTLVRPIVACAFAVIIAQTADPKGIVARVAAARIPYLLGVMSYSLYLVHVPVIVAFRGSPDAFGGGFWAFVLLAGGVSVAVGGAFYLAVERPFQRLRRRLVPDARGPAPEGR